MEKHFVSSKKALLYKSLGSNTVFKGIHLFSKDALDWSNYI